MKKLQENTSQKQVNPSYWRTIFGTGGRTAKKGIGLGMKWVLAGMLILPLSAQAGEFVLEVHVASKHFISAPESLGEFNEQNYGLGLQYQINDKWRVSGGAYENSFMSHSYECGTVNGIGVCSWEPETQISKYVSAGRSFYQGDGYELGIEAGVADGYEGWNSDRGFRNESERKQMKTFGDEYMPMVGPYLTLGNQYAMKIRYMPTVLVSASFQYRF